MEPTAVSAAPQESRHRSRLGSELIDRIFGWEDWSAYAGPVTTLGANKYGPDPKDSESYTGAGAPATA